MANNILQLPFRRSYHVNLSAAIKQYISTKYDQHPDMFADDLQRIDQLRRDAINVQEAHVSGIKKLTTYAAQLRWIGGKFPIDIGVDFPWTPALGFHTNQPVLQNNLRFELANVLFNLAALYSQLAYSTNRTTKEGLKTAAQYGVDAAGTLFFLRTEIVPEMRSTPPEDMDEMTLESLQNLCLAQAQECYWQTAAKGDMKDAIIAKLAAKVSDYYSTAEDFALKSDAISTEWIHHFTAKHHHFAAAAQYRQALDCLEKRKYGEEVARLKDSIVCVDEALTQAKWINKTVLGDLQGLKMRVTEDLKRAEKDNDVIYLLPVPPKSELKLLDRANMVSARPPKEIVDGVSMLGPGGQFGEPLFAKLVPYAVHQAASIYADRRDRLVNQTIIADLEAMTARLREILQSLNLPGSLQALEKPLGLPPSLVSKAEELRQQDGHYRLRRSMEDTAKLRLNDQTIYENGMELLASEKAEDDRARAKYGTERWCRPPSEVALQKLYAQSTELRGYLHSAAASDDIVAKKMADNEHILRVLTGTTRDLESYVPSSRRTTTTPAIENASTKLRACLNDVARLEMKRKRKIEALEEKAKADDINQALLAETSRLEREFPMQKIEAAQFEALFDARLEEYNPERTLVETEQDEQDQLAARVREANKNFLDARKGDSSTRDRERALQELETGYVRYKEIVANLETGRKFYNDLAGHVGRFREACKTQTASRKTEAGVLEAEIANQAMAKLSLEETSASLQQQRRQQHQQQQENIQGRPEPPLQAPVPTRAVVSSPTAAAAAAPLGVGGVWSPDMGIRFGGPATQVSGAAGYPQPRRG